MVDNPKPAKLYANVKTHKTDWPYRFIMSARGTATENLARWLEFQLKPYARMHEANIKDTKSFLLHLEHLNQTTAPFKEGTKLISCDIVNYYPNCSTELRLQAVKKILDDKATGLSEINKVCILEALSITMSSYNGQFQEKRFTQIVAATIGGPESASVTDIFGAVYIDEVGKQGDGSLKPSDWCRYRDDTWDIEEVCDYHMVKNFTNYLNETILKDKIKFEPVTKETGSGFLDVKVHLKNGYLIPEIYSKETDSHKYLNANSAHPCQSKKTIHIQLI